MATVCQIGEERGGVPSHVEKRDGAFFRLVKCTASRPPWQAATGGMRHGQTYQGNCASARTLRYPSPWKGVAASTARIAATISASLMDGDGGAAWEVSEVLRPNLRPLCGDRRRLLYRIVPDSLRQAWKYTLKKLAAQRQLPVGKQVTSHGQVKWASGKTGKVVRHERRGGVFVKVDDKEFVCSPFAFLKEKKADKKAEPAN